MYAKLWVGLTDTVSPPNGTEYRNPSDGGDKYGLLASSIHANIMLKPFLVNTKSDQNRALL